MKKNIVCFSIILAAGLSIGCSSGGKSKGVTVSSAERCSSPVANIAAGIYNSDQTVTLTSSTSGASIYYTTDGSAPSTSSALYSSAITVSGDGTTELINAVAVKTGMTASAVSALEYRISYTTCAAPVFSPSTATYNSDQTVTLNSNTDGAVIYYTTDGTTPSAASAKYTGPFTVSGDDSIVSVQALAVKSGMKNSIITNAVYTISYLTCSAPVFDLSSGTYNTDQALSISCSTSGAVIYYTTDGSTPTSSSSVYDPSTTLLISGDGTTASISAIAEKPGMKNSVITESVYSISYSACASPEFSPAGGTYNSDQTVSMTCNSSGASIYYTTDGSTPTTSSEKYSSPVSISGNGTCVRITAVAVGSQMKNSVPCSSSYTISYDTCAAPLFSPAGATYNSDQTVELSTTTAGAIIYYTVDGNTPYTSSTKYTGPFSVEGDGTITAVQAIAVKSGMNTSSVSAETYTISYSYCATPVFSLADGSYNSDQSMTISCLTEGAAIYYTIDGTTPTSSSAKYTSGTSIALSGDGTSYSFCALAVKSGMKNSVTGCASYTISYDTCAAPVFSIDSGIYNTDQSIYLSSVTGGASIYYTTDGTVPTSASALYSEAISVSGSGTSASIRAIAVASGYRNSSVSYASYAISYTQCSAPEFSPEGGTFNSDQTVSISMNTTGASIYYTTDGSTPTTSSSVYSGPLSVSGNGTSRTIKALTYKSGMTSSSVVSQAYIINTGTCTVPVLSPSAGFYTSSQSVALGSTTSGASIYYTIDGSTPTTSSTLYSGAIPLTGNGTTTIKALAVHSDMMDSSLVAGVYTISSTPLSVSGTVTTLISAMSSPQGVATDGTNLYISDTHSYKIYEYPIASSTLSVLAGTGSQGTTDGTGAGAAFYFPWGMATDGLNIYVTDAKSNSIRKIVISTGVVTTIAGSTASGTTDAIGISARFNTPCGLAMDGENLYIADQGNHLIRKMSLTTYSVSTLAGSGSAAFADGIGTAASFNTPSNITTDGTNLYIADSGNYRIRKIVLATGAVTTIAGSSTSGYLNGTGTAAHFTKPFGIFTDGTNIYVSDYTDHTVRRIVISTQAVTLVAGKAGTSGSTNGSGSSSLFNTPTSLTTDGTSLFVSDHFNGMIRKIQ